MPIKTGISMMFRLAPTTFVDTSRLPTPVYKSHLTCFFDKTCATTVVDSAAIVSARMVVLTCKTLAHVADRPTAWRSVHLLCQKTPTTEGRPPLPSFSNCGMPAQTTLLFVLLDWVAHLHQASRAGVCWVQHRPYCLLGEDAIRVTPFAATGSDSNGQGP